MNSNQQAVDGVAVRQFEYEDDVVLAADVGVGDASVDVVGDTVIVVVDGEQHEFDAPEGSGDAEADVNNGILTVEVAR